jgi:hypothetical protein
VGRGYFGGCRWLAHVPWVWSLFRTLFVAIGRVLESSQVNRPQVDSIGDWITTLGRLAAAAAVEVVGKVDCAHCAGDTVVVFAAVSKLWPR